MRNRVLRGNGSERKNSVDHDDGNVAMRPHGSVGKAKTLVPDRATFFDPQTPGTGEMDSVD